MSGARASRRDRAASDASWTAAANDCSAAPCADRVRSSEATAALAARRVSKACQATTNADKDAAPAAATPATTKGSVTHACSHDPRIPNFLQAGVRLGPMRNGTRVHRRRPAGCLHLPSGAGGALDADKASQLQPRRGQPASAFQAKATTGTIHAPYHCPRPACPLNPTAELAPADRLALAKPVGAARDRGEQPTPRGLSHPPRSTGPTGTTSWRPAGPPDDRDLSSHDEPQDHFFPGDVLEGDRPGVSGVSWPPTAWAPGSASGSVPTRWPARTARCPGWARRPRR